MQRYAIKRRCASRLLQKYGNEKGPESGRKKIPVFRFQTLVSSGVDVSLGTRPAEHLWGAGGIFHRRTN